MYIYAYVYISISTHIHTYYTYIPLEGTTNDFASPLLGSRRRIWANGHGFFMF